VSAHSTLILSAVDWMRTERRPSSHGPITDEKPTANVVYRLVAGP